MTPDQTSPVRTAARWLLGAALVFAGTSHFRLRDEFRAQIPNWLPLDADLVIAVSGVVEIALGLALLLLARHRVVLGIVAAALFVAVFPGNVAQYVEGNDGFGLDTDRSRLVRLFFQPLLVAWALWCTGAWAALADRRRRRT
jgi:uncharacterized membrane protein